MAKCDTVDGEWEGNPCNPILTHRNMGKRANIVNVGHGDLVDTPDGKWWMVCLASRPQGNGDDRVSPLGRETFIVPVEFEDGWPLASPDTGKIVDSYNGDGSVAAGGGESDAAGKYLLKDDFSDDKIAFKWLSLRDRNEGSYSLNARKGWLRLFTNGGELTETGKTNFFGVRQQLFDYALSVDVDFVPETGETAGIALFQSETFQYRFELYNDGAVRARAIKIENDKKSVLAEKDVSFVGAVRLNCVCKNQKLSFSFSACPDKTTDATSPVVIADNCDATILSTERAGGFVGNVLGFFVTGSNDSRYADFTNFCIQEAK